MIIFAGVMYNGFTVNQKRKKIIEMQKEVVGQKQKEVLDCIYYDQKIQKALITSEKYIDKKLQHLNKS